MTATDLLVLTLLIICHIVLFILLLRYLICCFFCYREIRRKFFTHTPDSSVDLIPEEVLQRHSLFWESLLYICFGVCLQSSLNDTGANANANANANDTAEEVDDDDPPPTYESIFAV